MDKTLIIWALETLREQASDAKETSLVRRINNEIEKIKFKYEEQK
jgi:hypothetical protein